MEAARLPMIYFAPKISTEKTEFTSVLLSLITTHFEEDASGYAKECRELDELRVAVCSAPMDYTACSTFKRYYCQLCFLLNRFPFLVGESVPGLDFLWEDTYESNGSTHREVEFEKAAVMYNIAAIHSFLGTSDNRSTADGMKVSCTHLQCAAWAFQQVRDNFNSTYAEDWTYDILSFQEQTMLGQSQECILEKSMADNRKSSITAKVAAQCAEFYKKALSHLESGNLSSHFGSSQTKRWKKHLELKVNFTQCVTYYYMTLQAEEQQNYGERLAYAQAAASKLADCVKLSQGMSEEVKTAIQFINDVVTGKYTAAKKENDFVYHAKVPSLDSLPEIKGAVLVKGIGFDVSDKTVSGPDIFAKLVPMEAHEASSLYSEEKAKLLREVGGRLDEHDTILGQYMASLQINTDKLLPQFDTIPDVLVEKCAAISVRPDTMKDLNKAMNELAGISTSTLSAIDKTETLLQDETELEEEFQSKFGKRRVLVLVEEITAELEKCKQAFTKASQSNTELHKAMELHVQNLNLLVSPLEEIKAALPNPQSVLADNEVAVVMRIKQLFAKIEEMRTQRTELYNKLREQVMADDITKTIVTRSSDDTKELFAAQLTKHDELIGQIDVYMNAQPKILEALDKANVDFVPIKQKIDLALQQRDARVEALIYSYDVYEDLLDKQQKGMEFYKKLKHNVERLLEKISGLHTAQQKEREMIAEKMKPKGPPPQRPTANKPGATPQSKPDVPEDSKDGPPPKPTGGTPKLKDYLPFMKAGGNAAAAIDSIVDGSAIEDDMAELDDLDDVELPDVSATPKLKDFLPFMNKNKPTGAPAHGNLPAGSGHDTAEAGDLAELAPQLMKYLPQNMAVGTGTMPGGRPTPPQRSQRPPMFSTAQFCNTASNVPRYAGVPAQPRPNPGNNFPQARPVQPQSPNMSNYGARLAAPTSSGGYVPAGPRGHMSSMGNTAQQQATMMAGNMPSQPGLATSYPSSPRQHPHGNEMGPGGSQNRSQFVSAQSTSSGNTFVSQSPNEYGVSGQPMSSTGRTTVAQGHPLPSNQMQTLPPPQNQMGSQGQLPQNQMPSQGQPPQNPMHPQGQPPQNQVHPDGQSPQNQMHLQRQLPQNQMHAQGQPLQNQVHPQCQPSQSQIPSQGQPLQNQMPSQGQPPQSQMPSQGQPPQSQMPSQSQPPQSQMPSQGQPPQSQMPSQGQPPQSQMPSQGQPPQSQMPSQGQPPQSQMPSQGRLPQSQMPSQGQLPQTQMPSQGQLPQSQMPSQSQLPRNQTLSQGQPPQYQMHPQGQLSQSHIPSQGQPSQNQIPSQGQPPPNQMQQRVQQPSQMQFQSQLAGQTLMQNQMPPQSLAQSKAQPPQQYHMQSENQLQPGQVRGPLAQQQPIQPGQQFSAAQLTTQTQLHSQLPTTSQSQIPLQNEAQQLNQPHLPSPQNQPFLMNSLVSQQHTPQNAQMPSHVQVQSGMQPHGQLRAQGHAPGHVLPHGHQVSQRHIHPQQQVGSQGPTGPSGQVGSQEPVRTSMGPQNVRAPSQSGSQDQLRPQGQTGPQGQMHLQGQVQPQNQLARGQASMGMQMPTPTNIQGSQQASTTLYPKNEQHVTSSAGLRASRGPMPNQFSTITPNSNSSQGQRFPVFSTIGPVSAAPNANLSQAAQTPASTQSIIASQQQPAGMLPGSNYRTTLPTPTQPGPNSSLQQSNPMLRTSGPEQFSNQIVAPSSPYVSQQQWQQPNSMRPPAPQQALHGPKPNLEDLFGASELPEAGVLLPSSRTTDNNASQAAKSENLDHKQPQPNQPSHGAQQHQQIAQEPHKLPSSAPQPPNGAMPQQQQHNIQPTSNQLPNMQKPQTKPQSLPPLQQPIQDTGKQGVNPQALGNVTNSSTPSNLSTEKGGRSWLPNQPGTQTHGSQTIPVLAVSPQPKSHVSDLEGVTIAPPSRLESSFQSSIDWSKATITPQPTSTKKDTTDAPAPKPTSSDVSKRSESGSNSRRSSLSRQMSRDHRDPYSDEASLNQFVSAVERYVKHLDTLTKPSLKGPTPLDKEWQDMCEEQEREQKRNSTAAGLSESTRNRHPDYIPYDKYRVVLSGQKNDYINASMLENLPSGCPRFIATQGPLNQTEADFWNMIVQEKVELIVMVSRWTEQDNSESARYWPRDRSDRLSFGNLLITLLLTNNHKHWIERRIVMTNLVTKESHTVTQLQFTCWPAQGTPEPMPLLMLVNEVTSFHRKQRNSNTPIIVHCGNGASKTGVFCTLYNGVLAVNSGQGITSVAQTVGLLRQRRKGMVSSKEEYSFCHTALLYYAQDILVKRGILTSQASFSNPLPSSLHQTHRRTPSNDFIMSDTSLALLGELSSFTSSPDSTPKVGSRSSQQSVEKKIETEKPPAVKIDHSKDSSSPHATDPTTIRQSMAFAKDMDIAKDTAVAKDTDVAKDSAAAESKKDTGAAGSSLLDISNPQTFDIGEGRQRITKADFINPTRGIKTGTSKGDDPLSSLDAMWSLAGK